MAYYENPTMLRKQYENLRTLKKYRDYISVIIVDDGSPDHPAFAEDLDGMSLQIFRMQQDIRWNQDACRNIGAREATTEWLLLTDMDHMVPSKTWGKLIQTEWDEQAILTFTRVTAPEMQVYKFHPNTWFMTKAMFDKTGGYDERFAGYYGTDGDFRNRVKDAGLVVECQKHIIRIPRELVSDASTTRYERKTDNDRINIARIKEERSLVPNWQPLRNSFRYDRVYP